MDYKKAFLSIFVFLMAAVTLPEIVAIGNSEVIYEPEVADFSDYGIDLVEADGSFRQKNLTELQVGEVFIDVDETAKKIVSISQTQNRIVIETEEPTFYEVLKSYKLPEQDIEITFDENLAGSRSEVKVLDKSLSVHKDYSNNVGNVSFGTTLKALLNVNANIDIPVKNKKGLMKVGSKFELGMSDAKIQADISKEYKSEKIELVKFNEKNSVLKINTKIVTQTIANGAINAEMGLSGKVCGEIAFSSVLERRLFQLPLPTKCAVTRDLQIEMKEKISASTQKSTCLEQMLGIEIDFSLLGINIANISSNVEPYVEANGKADVGLTFEVDKDFKVNTKRLDKLLEAECEIGIDSDTSLSLIKNLYHKDFGEKSLVIYRCAGSK